LTERYIDVRNMSKVYPGADAGSSVQALAGVSMRIEDGERVGIIGPNGAGKSTLLQIVSGVTPPTGGEFEVKGKIHAILSVGMGMREEATGRENLFLDGALVGRSTAETQARLQDMIDFAELGDFIDQPVRTYSTGMKARLGFASLITIDPEILIIDEALSVGDVFFGDKATRAIKNLTDKGGIVIVVTHSLAAIEQMCSRAIWIDAGKVRMDGASRDVTAAYRTELHEREEIDIRKKFGVSGAPWTSKGATHSVEEVSLLPARGGVARQIFESGEHAKLLAHLKGDGFRKPSRLRIWVERNDGLVLFDEQIDVAPQPASSKPPKANQKAPGKKVRGSIPDFGLEVDLGALSWRPFIYQIHAEVIGPKGAVAHNAATFKIWSAQNALGGAPVLSMPISISSVREGPVPSE
jgi:lipopolysaccharide transport system ATP-binding protein